MVVTPAGVLVAGVLVAGVLVAGVSGFRFKNSSPAFTLGRTP